MKPKQKIYLSVAIFGIISILLIALVIYPLLRDIKKNSEALIFQKKRLISFQEEIKNLKEIESIYKTHQSDLDKIGNLFVDPEVLIEFISFSEKNAQISQLKIEILPLAKRAETEPWPSLSFQISALGSFPNFLKFLEKLENSFYLIEILNLNIKRLAKEEIKFGTFSPGDINAIFSIKVYTK